MVVGWMTLLWSHDHRMIDKGYPPPPPLVDPGPDAATLDISLIQADSNQITTGIISVNNGAQEPEDDPLSHFSLRMLGNRHKGPIRHRDLDYYFFTSGRFSIRVPPGLNQIKAGKGYEYLPVEISVSLRPGETRSIEIPLHRWIDMAETNWHSGDTHLHFERTGKNDELLVTLLSARDIKYGFILSMNTGGYDAGGEFESWSQNKGLGERSVFRKGPYRLSSGQEYRAQALGHMNLLMVDDYVQGGGYSDDVTGYPSLELIADQAHQLNGFVGLNHGGYDDQQGDGLGLSGKIDFLELLQFGGYRGLGLDGWYDFLNIGYRWPIIAGSDFPYTRELGDCLTYVYSEETPTVRGFLERASRGESFVTSGPMLFVTVNGKRPGSLLRLRENGRSEKAEVLEVEIRVLSPVYPVHYLEIIQDGRVEYREFSSSGKSQWSLRHQITARQSGWIAVRAYSDAGTEAHTNPVYYFIDGKRLFVRSSSNQILARLDDSIVAIENSEIRARLSELHERLTQLRDTGINPGLRLPPVP